MMYTLQVFGLKVSILYVLQVMFVRYFPVENINIID